MSRLGELGALVMAVDATNKIHRSSWEQIPLLLLAGIAPWAILAVLPHPISGNILHLLLNTRYAMLIHAVSPFALVLVAIIIFHPRFNWRVVAIFFVSLTPFSVDWLRPFLWNISRDVFQPLLDETRWVDVLLPLFFTSIAVCLLFVKKRYRLSYLLLISMALFAFTIWFYKASSQSNLGQWREYGLIVVPGVGAILIGASLGYVLLQCIEPILMNTWLRRFNRRLPFVGAMLGVAGVLVCYFLFFPNYLFINFLFMIFLGLHVPVVLVSAIMLTAWFDREDASARHLLRV